MKRLEEGEVLELLYQEYEIQASLNSLPGYEELNFQVLTTSGEKLLLKIADESASLPFLEAQIAILAHLSNTDLSHQFQQCIPNKRGASITQVFCGKEAYYMRLYSFIEGKFWVEQTLRPAELHKALGSFLGKMDSHLSAFAHPAMHRRYTWDISTALDNLKEIAAIRDPEKKRIAAYFLMQFETHVLPVLHHMRHAYVHNDANDYNVLVDGEEIRGLIDFGDMVYTLLVNNLAVACTYAMFGDPDPIAVAARVVEAYHKAYPLLELETDLLYYLIAGRLCISVVQSALQSLQQSDNTHHFVTEDNAWNLLQQLIRINPLLAKDAFRKAAGFQPAISTEVDRNLLRERKQLIGKNLSISYNEKLNIQQGALQYLYDNRGRTFIDCVNNPSHVGHCHPVVVRRMQQQIATLNTNTRYLHELITTYAGRLIRTLPKNLEVCYFVNSGSEANDLAIRMSRCYTGQEDVIVLDHAYHGNSTLAIDISPYKFDSKGGTGRRSWVHKAELPDTYRGRFAGTRDAGMLYAADVERIIQELDAKGKKPAAFISETLLGVGGQMPLPEGYLKAVYGHVRSVGGVCIADEVQVGFGRVGKSFWGFELQEVQPDIVVLGKPIGNGHPLGAVIVSKAIAEAFNNGLEYFNTFGGNPVSMATGLAVIDVIESEGMLQHAHEVGNYLIEKLKELMHHHKIIGDVRGYGLFIGVELVKDRQSKLPLVPEVDEIVEAMKERGFLLSTDGPLHNVLKIKPPMTFNKENADALVNQLDMVLKAM